MKKITFLVCLALGVMTTACEFSSVIEENYQFPADALVMCEPASDTHYSMYYVTANGKKVSTLVPYVYENENHQNYEVLEVGYGASYRGCRITNESSRQIVDGNFCLVERNRRVVINFAEYSVNYYITDVIPSTYTQNGESYIPKYELVSYSLKDLPDETKGEKPYYCTELKIIFRAHQGEKEIDFIKTVKLMQEKKPIEFGDVSVNEWV